MFEDSGLHLWNCTVVYKISFLDLHLRNCIVVCSELQIIDLRTALMFIRELDICEVFLALFVSDGYCKVFQRSHCIDNH